MSIDASDELRTLETLTQPDPRQPTGAGLPEFLQRTLAQHQADLAELRLDETAPEDLQIHFLTAVNLLLYSWFVYRFLHVAELHALGALEWALRDRVKGKKNLGPLLAAAIKRKMLKDSPLRAFQRHAERQRRAWDAEQQWPDDFRALFGTRTEPKPAIDDQAWVRVLAKRLPMLRNDLAHGSPLLYSEGVLRVELCRDLINQLYRRDDSPGESG
jgi:hypothetical protein